MICSEELHRHTLADILIYITLSIPFSFLLKYVMERSLKSLHNHKEIIDEELILFCVDFLSSLLGFHLEKHIKEVLLWLQEQHSRIMQFLTRFFQILRFVGASTGGITSSASETHALSLLSVRLSAFAGIGMSHFFASSTSHCKYGDRAYGSA
jgi:hypothetical protein